MSKDNKLVKIFHGPQHPGITGNMSVDDLWSLVQQPDYSYQLIAHEQALSIGSDGTSVETQENGGFTNQKWWINQISGDIYGFSNLSNGKNIEILASSQSSGAAVIGTWSSESSNQQWEFIEA